MLKTEFHMVLCNAVLMIVSNWGASWDQVEDTGKSCGLDFQRLSLPTSMIMWNWEQKALLSFSSLIFSCFSNRSGDERSQCLLLMFCGFLLRTDSTNFSWILAYSRSFLIWLFHQFESISLNWVPINVVYQLSSSSWYIPKQECKRAVATDKVSPVSFCLRVGAD